MNLVPATSRPSRPITFTDSPAGISSTLSDSPPITFTDLPDDSGSLSLSDSQQITFTDSPEDPPFQTASQLPSRTCQTYRYEGRLEGAIQIFYSNLFRRLSGPSQPITFTDSPDDSRSSSLSDSQPITFTDSPDDPPSQTASPYRPCARIFRAFFCTA